MKIVQVFKTDDGKTFENRIDARKHEVETEAFDKLKQLLQAGLSTGRPESVLRQILMESAAVSTILVNYRKKQPKETSANTVAFPATKGKTAEAA